MKLPILKKSVLKKKNLKKTLKGGKKIHKKSKGKTKNKKSKGKTKKIKKGRLNKKKRYNLKKTTGKKVFYKSTIDKDHNDMLTFINKEIYSKLHNNNISNAPYFTTLPDKIERILTRKQHSVIDSTNISRDILEEYKIMRDFLTKELYKKLHNNNSLDYPSIDTLPKNIEKIIKSHTHKRTKKLVVKPTVLKKIVYENWISTHFKDENYRIVETDDNGDCFFDSIRKGLLHNHIHTTVKHLRGLLVQNVTQDNLDFFKTLYLGARLDNDNEMITEFRFMENIETLDQLKRVLLKPSFWANSWAIGVIEKALNIKVLILSEGAYERGDIVNVIQCGDASVSNVEPVCSICNLTKSDYDLKKNLRESNRIHARIGIEHHNWVDRELEEELNPDGYIIVTYSGRHYELVTHKNKGFFKTLEDLPLPLVVEFYDNCVRKQNFKGAFASIKEFKEFRNMGF